MCSKDVLHRQLPGRHDAEWRTQLDSERARGGQVEAALPRSTSSVTASATNLPAAPMSPPGFRRGSCGPDQDGLRGHHQLCPRTEPWLPREPERPSIAAADDYAITNPWDPNCLGANAASDCLWEYGAETRNVIADDTSGHPVWMVVESGTDGIRFSSQNGSVCNPTTNLCSRGNGDRATPVQVNSAAWLTLINGANGLEWFCDDSVSAPDACAGGGRNGHAAACSFTCRIPANLSYIDHAVESFARELNVASASRPTVRSSNARVPIDTMVKVVNGVTYLFAESDRNGSTTGSFEFSEGWPVRRRRSCTTQTPATTDRTRSGT